jgi:hypothetical protein
MMLSVSWPLNISPRQRCIDAGRDDVVGYCSTKPYSATFDNVAKHTYMIDYRALDLPDHVIEAQLGRTLNSGHELGRIVSRYLADLRSHAISTTPLVDYLERMSIGVG